MRAASISSTSRLKSNESCAHEINMVSVKVHFVDLIFIFFSLLFKKERKKKTIQTKRREMQLVLISIRTRRRKKQQTLVVGQFGMPEWERDGEGWARDS